MTTKEKIVRKSISAIEKRLQKLRAILDARPLSELIQIQIEFKELLESGADRKSKAFQDRIEELNDRNEAQLAIVEKQKNSVALINKIVKLEGELADLNNELYYIERKK